MHKKEIPQEEWKEFFNSFNEQNNGRMAYIEITDDEHYRQQYSESIAFNDIKMSLIDNEHITISVNAGDNSSFKQFVDRIDRVIAESNNGSIKELHLLSSLGRGAIIKFHDI